MNQAFSRTSVAKEFHPTIADRDRAHLGSARTTAAIGGIVVISNRKRSRGRS